MTHLSFTTPQLDALLDGARRVPIGWRHRYLEAVALLLGCGGMIDDAAVQTAVSSTLQRIGLTKGEHHETNQLRR